MLESFTPVLILMGLALVTAVGIVAASHILNPYRPTPAKQLPYESGITPVGGTRERFSVKFYLVAILFIVFDLETIFLIPWAVAMRPLGWSGFWAAFIFIVILTVGLVYEWRKGALQWD